MTEFQELVKDAPEFALMGRGELAIYAYAMYAAGAKMEAENAKLRELVKQMHPLAVAYLHLMRQLGCIDDLSCDWAMQLQKLGIEVVE